MEERSIDQVESKNKKQFKIADKQSAIIYLRKIITVLEHCRYQMNIFLQQGRKIQKDAKAAKEVVIDYGTYSTLLRCLYGVEAYALNVIGDMQTSSISYRKFRKQIGKIQRKGGSDIHLPDLTEEEKEDLNRFTEARNFENHIPESILVAEQELIADGTFSPETEDPLEVYLYRYVTLEYFEDLVDQYSKLYQGMQDVIDRAMRDYCLLMGREIKLQIVTVDQVLEKKKLVVGKKAFDAQR